jgi:hypothetical protein
VVVVVLLLLLLVLLEQMRLFVHDCVLVLRLLRRGVLVLTKFRHILIGGPRHLLLSWLAASCPCGFTAATLCRSEQSSRPPTKAPIATRGDDDAQK